MIIIIFMIVALVGFIIGLSLADKIAQNKIDVMRSEMQIDCKEPNMWIDGNWYTEFEVEEMLHNLKYKVKELEDENVELKKSVDIYRTMANNAMLERNDESEVCD